jgi:hypothetical protein
MAKFGFVFLVLAGLCISNPAFGKEGVYNSFFKHLGESDYIQLSNAMYFSNPKMIYSAVRRVGELKITNARDRVREIFSEARPHLSGEGARRSAVLRDSFLISAWTMGQIGNELDAQELADSLKDIRDRESRIVIINSLGELKYAIAINTLHNLSRTETDQDAARAIVDAIKKHNLRNSYIFLVDMAERPSFNKALREHITNVANHILNQGK